jgi:type II secretory pathway component GspD/PulD (secretin)/beta-lactamase regulating signal transducer with metallopeptidase domain
MNSFIESLNELGGNFLSFAWPMLWQSSLLIVVLFTFDFLFRRKLRASIRYALWLVVLLKLCLPTTFALPTSPAWWLHKTPPPIVAKPQKHFTVTYDNAPLPEIQQAPLPVFVSPKPAMTNAAWLLVVSAAVSSALFVWLLVRWWQITRQIRRAATSERLSIIAAKAQKVVGMKFKVQVKLTTNSMSPAVCGLFRPVILIPQSLAENFSDEQLRAVLLHELIHLLRRDVWMNFAQALLQIFYWWHPLVWLANARIRRVREEAVDDAVMLALRDEAESYAPTLLEVAKLALNRPLASLGLVGILESRHALRQRIERLVDFRPPRQAGLTLVSIFGILAFTAVAVPMGEGPTPAENKILFAPAPAVSAQPAVLQKTNLPSILVTTHFYRALPAEFEKIAAPLKFNQGEENGDSWWSVPADEFSQIHEKLNATAFQRISASRVMTLSGETAEMFVGNETNSVSFSCLPVVDGGLIKLTMQGKTIDRWMNVAVTNQFKTKSTLENHGGIVIRVENSGGSTASNLVVFIGVEIVTTTVDTNSFEGQIQADKMVQDAKLLYEMGKLEEAESKLKAAIVLNPDNQSAYYYRDLIEKAREARLAATFPPSSGIILPVWKVSPSTATNYLSEGRQKIVSKLDRIRFDLISYDPPTPLSEVIRDLSKKIRASDPEKKGINFLINNNKQNATTSGNAPAGSDEPVDIGSYLIKLNLKDARLADVLDAIVLSCDHPIKYSILDYGIVFSLKDESPPDESPPLFERMFKVDKIVFVTALKEAAGLQTTNVSTMARSLFGKLGVDWDSPKGKSVVYNDRLGMLFVRATAPDLDIIERAIETLNQVPPQVHIKARFIELSQDDGNASGFDWYLGHFGSNNVIGKVGGSPSPAVPVSAANPLGVFSSNTTSSTGGQQYSARLSAPFTGILTDTNLRVVLHALEQRGKSEVLGEPEVVTTSGRRTIMKATSIVSNVRVFTDQGTATNSGITPQIESVEFGPVLDSTAWVLSDGYTIDLSIDAGLVYDTTTNTTVADIKAGNKINLPVVLPTIHGQGRIDVNVWDGQTVVLGGLILSSDQTTKDKVPFLGDLPLAGRLFQSQSKTEISKKIMVFVTATIVDAAGNRIHSDDEMPFAKAGVPSQQH